jgi:transposase-like protein
VARYGHTCKDRVVARLLPPESSAVELVSRELGVSAATLERWRSAALAVGSGERPDGSSGGWTAAARLAAVIATAAMDEASRNGWCREHGLYPTQRRPGSRTRSPGWASGGQPVA